MLTLSLLRHAKSSWDDERLTDFDRPLAERGRKAAPRMGRYMRRIGLAPDRVLCSPAVRTRETALLVLPELFRRPPVDYVAEIYEADANELLTCVASTESGPQRLLLIGHNPGLQELALLLADAARTPERTEIGEKFPTAALAVLELAVVDWQDVRPACGRIVHFATPRKLEEE